MRRMVAVALVSALLSIAGSSAWQHVHAYGDHDHPEHLHGPAAHEHGADAHPHARPDGGSSFTIEACEPGTHIASVVFTFVAPYADHAAPPALVSLVGFVPTLTSQPATVRRDVRAHGPPRLTDAPLRAPPLVIPA
jgi:hypothetical protein